MNWLITGGCGFIGCNLAHDLLLKGEQVTIIDNLSRLGSRDNLLWLRNQHGREWGFTQEDVRSTEAMEKIIADYSPDVVAHLAGQVAMTTSIQNPRMDFEINALGTLNILEAVRKRNPKSIILFSSTNKVYGSLEQFQIVEKPKRYEMPDFPQGLAEDVQLDGHSPYGCSKLAGDQYIRDYHRIYGLQTVVFRHSSMYGGRQYATFDQGWIGWFCQKAIEMKNPNSQSFTISGNGKQVRDVLYADDLINVYEQAVNNISRTSGNIYNIGGGVENSLSLLELFDMLESFTGYAMRYTNLDWRPGDQKFFVANARKAHGDFYWEPKVTKEEGIRNMLNWSREIMNDI